MPTEGARRSKNKPQRAQSYKEVGKREGLSFEKIRARENFNL